MKMASARNYPLVTPHRDCACSQNFIRWTLGKRENPEAVAHLVQDNWNGAFTWSISVVFFKGGADWLKTSEHKFRLLLKWSARGRQVSGDKTDQKQIPLLYMKSNRCHSHVEQGGYLCYSQIKLWQDGNMTNDKRTSFSKRGIK